MGKKTRKMGYSLTEIAKLMSYLMGIDLGSTSTKAVIYDTEGNIAAFADRPTEVAHLDSEHPAWAFWEPEKIWNSTVSAIQEAVEKIYSASEIKGLAVTGMGMDGLPIDEHGKWLYPFISWLCPRTEPQSRAWSEKVGPENIFNISGKQVLPIDTVYRLIWMQENQPEILEKTDKWLLIEDFVNFMLCGRQATDYTMASCTSLFDQKTHTWSEKLFSSAGIDMSLFPEPLPGGTILGEVTAESASLTGLAKGTPVVLGGHDYICAALAVGAFMPDVVMDVTGTWEIVSQSSPELILNKTVFDAGLVVESHVVKDTYLISGYSPSALMLEWFKENYAYEEHALQKQTGETEWEYLMEKAASAPCGANGAFFLPHFAGSGAPNNDNRALGAFVGLSTGTDKGCMIRAMIEGLDYQFRDMVEAMESALQAQTQKIIAVGGASRNIFWMQNKADVTGKIIEVPDMGEATTLGAALLAGIGVGMYKNEQEAYQRTFKPGKTYEPDMSLKAKYDNYFKIYKDVYSNLKTVNWQIFDEFRN